MNKASIAIKNTDNQKKICVVAGKGTLPKLIINELKKQGYSVYILALRDSVTNIGLDKFTHQWIKITELKTALDFLTKHNVKNIVFAGKIQRPSMRDIKVDTLTLKLLKHCGLKALSGGDDVLLSGLVSFLKTLDLNICSPQNIAPDLLCPKGVLSCAKPSKQDYEDINLGQAVLRAIGRLDVGQSIVVENNYVLGIEAAEGTDALIKRCKPLKKEKGQLGVLVKLKKSTQSSIVDLPTIGEVTIKNVYSAGLKGIAFEAGKSLILDKNKMVDLANKLGIFLVGV